MNHRVLHHLRPKSSFGIHAVIFAIGLAPLTALHGQEPAKPAPAKPAPAKPAPAKPAPPKPAPPKPAPAKSPTVKPEAGAKTPPPVAKPKAKARPKAKPKQARPPRFAISELINVDADFSVQGEYVGAMPGYGNWTGLQVIARGNGQFEGRLLSGGLPGAGWNRTDSVALRGGREPSGGVQLRGGPLSASLQGDRAELTDGTHAVRFRKIHRTSPSMGRLPPAGALVLVGAQGGQVGHLKNPRLTPEGLLREGTLTDFPVGGFRMHLEFRTPYMPNSQGQQRGNSGIYIQRRYEVQILDSFGLVGKENECGGLYRLNRPDVNMCLPPLSWQTYDIDFRPPAWDAAGDKIADARITVLHNGVPIHDDRAIVKKTGAGQKEAPTMLPIQIQDHRDPVRFRNIWLLHTVPAICCPCK